MPAEDENQVNEQDQQQNEESTEEAQDSVFCSECGAKNAAGAKFCEECGAELDGETADNETNNEEA